MATAPSVTRSRPSREPDVRAGAARLVAGVIEGGSSLSALLAAGRPEGPPSRDRALLLELVYGTLRWYPRLEAITGLLLERALPRRHTDIQALICVGLHQILEMRIPDHAAVSATVAATQSLGKGWAAKLVNALLRRYLRDTEQIVRQLSANAAYRDAHPRWLVQRFQRGWPEDWQRIVAANNRHAPMWVRINRARTSRDDYLARLAEAGIAARASALTATGVLLEVPRDVATLPGFTQGQASVQDDAAQLAAPLLEAQTGMRVLDACAAPGGKTAAILECCDSEVIAVDRVDERAQCIVQNLGRLGLSARVLTEDARNTDAWWDGRPFDRILLDAPCTGSGVIRRHPDMKILKRPDDVDALCRVQAELIARLWPLLRPGGKLLYATCSIFHEENQAQMRRFLANHRDAQEDCLDAAFGCACEVGRQILPGQDDMDGFYFARLVKLHG